MKFTLKSVLVATLLAVGTTTTMAQGAYPNRKVDLIVPFAPGGFTDVVARIMAQKLSANLGQQFVILNKPGAGSTIGTNDVAKAAPDGYTLVMVSSAHTVSPWVYKTMPYDPIKSFTPISKLVDAAYVMLVHPGVPANNVREFIALAKTKPDGLRYSSSGNGGAQHLMGGMFESMAGVKMQHVPYRGSAGATNDLVAGIVESGFAAAPIAVAQVPAGRLKAFAVTTAKRIPQLPDVPTMQEAGVPGYDASVWLALLGPAGMPRDVVNRLNAEVAKVMAQPDTQKALYDAGVEVALSTPEALQSYMVSELERWGKVVKDAKIEAE